MVFWSWLFGRKFLLLQLSAFPVAAVNFAFHEQFRSYSNRINAVYADTRILLDFIAAGDDAATSSSKDPAPPIVIFYQIYLPPDSNTKLLNALRIVKEQFRQLKVSYVYRNSKEQLTMYYVTIGKDGILTPEEMQGPEYCGGGIFGMGDINCAHLEHYDTGFEDRTLQKIHDFCGNQQEVQGDHPSIPSPLESAWKSPEDESASALSPPRQQEYRVLYMHNKGSYNEHGDGQYNERWRKHLTEAVTSKHCYAAPSSTDESSSLACSVCGLSFEAMPFIHVPGNFWVAKCGYVRRLLNRTSTRIGTRK